MGRGAILSFGGDCTTGFGMGVRNVVGSLPSLAPDDGCATGLGKVARAASPRLPSFVRGCTALRDEERRQLACLLMHRVMQLFFVVPPTQSGLLRHSSPTCLHFAAVAFGAIGADPAGMEIAAVAMNVPIRRVEIDVRMPWLSIC